MHRVLNHALRALAVAALLATTVGAAPVFADSNAAGAVYTLTNSASGNRVLIFDRAPDGTLTATGSVATGGNGGALGSQGSIALTGSGRWLIAANAGSNTISAFSVDDGGLTLTDQVASGGSGPNSITTHDSLVYVLNAGGTPNVSGFRLGDGHLAAIAGSTRNLGAAGAGPVEVAFDQSGRVLVVSDKAANKIETFVVGEGGVAGTPTVFDSSGPAPFGFDFGKHGAVIFSEAASIPAGSSSASSYTLAKDGTLTALSRSVSTTQGAACWLVVTKNGRFAYTANAASGTISLFEIDKETAALTLRNATAASGLAHPTDMAMSDNGKILYVLAAGSIVGYRIDEQGGLTWISTMTMTGTAGLAAR